MKNLVFDLGAVLITWEPVALVQAHFSQYAPTTESAQELVRHIFHHEDWLGFDRGTHGLDNAIGLIARRLTLPPDLLRIVLGSIGERLIPIDLTIGLLAELRERRSGGEEIRLYYLSNMPAPFARVLERRHVFFQWFDGGIFSGDVGVIKPQREAYDLLAYRYELVASDTIFIDDSLANIQAARELGWQGLHCESPATLPDLLRTSLLINSTSPSNTSD